MSSLARAVSVAVGVVVVLTLAASAQAQDAPKPFSMVTYYECAQGDTARADAIVKEQMVPFLKAEQAAGRLTGYGWNEHVEGGAWRRVMYFTGTSLDALADTRDGLAKLRQAPERVKAFEEFGRLCPSHEDYIWRSKSTSQTPGDIGRVRSAYSMSTYYTCDANEAEADAIVASVIAPLMNQRVKAGQIDSWNWMEHVFGGQYRRLLIMDGKDEKALLKNWDSMQEDVQKAAPDLARRWGNICHGHADYIWRRGLN
jgi:hypothetical protein